MRLGTLVGREILERKSQLATSFLSILLGISVIVSVQNILHFSEKAVAYELDALGANILILPKSATLQNYYSSDLQDEPMNRPGISTLRLRPTFSTSSTPSIARARPSSW